jgi:protein-S-isoprenylcysteine O-methyltransferase Ste14
VFLRWLLSIVALPGMVLVVVPAVILWVGWLMGKPVEPASPEDFQFWAGTALAFLGAGLGIWSTSMFFRHGDGTPAPWDPPRRFVVRGPYRHVRNPMILGVILLLLAEALCLQSWVLAVWATVFLLANAIYFPQVEEPALAKRFGEDYVRYCCHVGRWIPRLRPWRG